MNFYADEFWAAFEAVPGFLVDCTFQQSGGKVPKTVKVRWMEPDIQNLGGQQSKNYEIEYRTKDMPDLVEGVELSIAESDSVTTDYRVREAPYVAVEGGDDGTYKRAVLTRIVARD